MNVVCDLTNEVNASFDKVKLSKNAAVIWKCNKDSRYLEVIEFEN